MTEEITVNVNYALINREDIIRPYRYRPSLVNERGSHSSIFTEEQWNAYQWNPPDYRNFWTVPDPDASPKPTWSELVEYEKQFHLKRKRKDMYTIIDRQATDRINALYNVDITNPKRYREELIKRIVPDYPSAADTIRLEIIAKYRCLLYTSPSPRDS